MKSISIAFEKCLNNKFAGVATLIYISNVQHAAKVVFYFTTCALRLVACFELCSESPSTQFLPEKFSQYAYFCPTFFFFESCEKISK